MIIFTMAYLTFQYKRYSMNVKMYFTTLKHHFVSITKYILKITFITNVSKWFFRRTYCSEVIMFIYSSLNKYLLSPDSFLSSKYKQDTL